jgi:calcineurin-like phosphoesterase family protein
MFSELYVGDPHVVPEELDDCEALMCFVKKIEDEVRPDSTCILGDLHNNHNVIRAEVLAFWRRWARGRRLIVGNHDYAGEGLSIHALMAYEDIATVVDRPTMDRGVLYLPYYSDRAKFVADCNAQPSTFLVCHQTFDGSRYENGMYAPDGLDAGLLPQKEILSGHIHTPQTFGKVTYIGAPRWRSLSDANTDRAVWLYTFDDEGNAVEKISFDTSVVCRQIRHVIDTPDDPFDQTAIDPRHDWRIDVKGPEDYVQARKELLSPLGVKLRTFKTDRKAAAVRESEGIATAFRGFLNTFTPKHGTPTDLLGQMAAQRLGY